MVPEDLLLENQSASIVVMFCLLCVTTGTLREYTQGVLHWDLKAAGREREPPLQAWVFETAKPKISDTLPPTRPHLLRPVKGWHSLWTKLSKALTCEAHCHSSHHIPLPGPHRLVVRSECNMHLVPQQKSLYSIIVSTLFKNAKLKMSS